MFGLHAKVKFGKSGAQVVVEKGRSTIRLEAQSFSDLLARDTVRGLGGRYFDGEPYRWPELRKILESLDGDTLQAVVHKSARAMNSFPAVSWMFLFVQVLQDRNIPLPRGTLSCMLQMAIQRDDLYGMLEVMHVGLKERELHTTRGRSEVDSLSEHEWGVACSEALRRKPAEHLPLDSFKDAFLEVSM